MVAADLIALLPTADEVRELVEAEPCRNCPRNAEVDGLCGWCASSPAERDEPAEDFE